MSYVPMIEFELLIRTHSIEDDFQAIKISQVPMLIASNHPCGYSLHNWEVVIPAYMKTQFNFELIWPIIHPRPIFWCAFHAKLIIHATKYHKQKIIYMPMIVFKPFVSPYGLLKVLKRDRMGDLQVRIGIRVRISIRVSTRVRAISLFTQKHTHT
jgi:hypothetical protein